MSYDKRMYDEGRDTYATVNTSAIIEELGQINYIFTDKTGTLTQNVMILEKLSIDGVVYGKKNSYSEEVKKRISDSNVCLFLTHLTLCNSIVPETHQDESEINKNKKTANKSNVDSSFINTDLDAFDSFNTSTKQLDSFNNSVEPDDRQSTSHVYQSSSPDEIALVNGLVPCNVVFLSRDSQQIKFSINSDIFCWEVLNLFEFTSDRKKMSVIVRSPDNKIYLFCKGADTAIYSILADESTLEKDDFEKQKVCRKQTNSHMQQFARDGLRTLCIAYKEVSEDQYHTWSDTFYEANIAMVDRSEKLEKVIATMEKDLILLGATGIVDLLQEDVKDTISTLIDANIKFWMLTGDRLETAINIGYSTALLDESLNLLILDSEDIESCKDKLLEFIDKYRIFVNRTRSGKRINKEIHRLKTIPEAENADFFLNSNFPNVYLDEQINSTFNTNRSVTSDTLHSTGRNAHRQFYESSDNDTNNDSHLNDTDYDLVDDDKNQTFKSHDNNNIFIEENNQNITTEYDTFISPPDKKNNFKLNNSGSTAEAPCLESTVAINDRKSSVRHRQAKSVLSNLFFSSNPLNKNKLNNSGASSNLALIITGRALSHALDPLCFDNFLDLAISCQTVLCCRVSPLQKKLVVSAVKNNVNGAVTLAIGDGGNDCSMIQTAHVGVGINGREGMQAANCSDFAISQFRFLRPLLLFHGAACYRRLCNTIYFCFYKNVIFSMFSFVYSFHNSFSGTSIFTSSMISLLNLFFTSLPPFAFGLFDQACSYQAFMNIPTLYESSQKGTIFNYRRFVLWILNGVMHCLLLFFFCYESLEHGILSGRGDVIDMALYAGIFYTYFIVLVSFKAALELTSWAWITHICVWAGPIVWFLFLTIYCRPFLSSYFEPVMINLDIQMYRTLLFWFGLGLPFIVLLPDFIYTVIRNTLYKPSHLAVLELEKSKKFDWNDIRNIFCVRNEVTNLKNKKSRFIRKYLGFAFSVAEDFSAKPRLTMNKN